MPVNTRIAGPTAAVRGEQLRAEDAHAPDTNMAGKAPGTRSRHRSGGGSIMKRRVLIVEDDVFVGGLLAETLEAAGFETRHATSAAEARRAATEFDPDVALVDLDLGDGPSGVDLMRVFERTRPELVSVMLTASPSQSVRSRLPEHAGFIRKSLISEPAVLLETLDAALRRGGRGILHDVDEQSPLSGLSSSQREVLRLIALGLSNAEIAKRRGITLSGAEQAVSAVFRALELQQRDQLMPRVEAARLYIEARGLPKRADDG